MCRTDLGTGDEVGLDILINMLQGCSEEYVGIKQLIIGGVNEDWPVADALSPSPEVGVFSTLQWACSYVTTTSVPSVQCLRDTFTSCRGS